MQVVSIVGSLSKGTAPRSSRSMATRTEFRFRTRVGRGGRLGLALEGLMTEETSWASSSSELDQRSTGTRLDQPLETHRTGWGWEAEQLILTGSNVPVGKKVKSVEATHQQHQLSTRVDGADDGQGLVSGLVASSPS